MTISRFRDNLLRDRNTGPELVRLFADIVEAQGIRGRRGGGHLAHAASRGLQQLERSLGSSFCTDDAAPGSDLGRQVSSNMGRTCCARRRRRRASVEGLGRTLRDICASRSDRLGGCSRSRIARFAKAHPQVTSASRSATACRTWSARRSTSPSVHRRAAGGLCRAPAGATCPGGYARHPPISRAARSAGRRSAGRSRPVAPPPTDGRRYPLMLARGPAAGGPSPGPAQRLGGFHSCGRDARGTASATAGMPWPMRCAAAARRGAARPCPARLPSGSSP